MGTGTLKIKSSPPRPTRRPWTTDEETKLAELLSAGEEAAEIAAALQADPAGHLCPTATHLSETNEDVGLDQCREILKVKMKSPALSPPGRGPSMMSA
jgi:hypothetical protein